MPHTARPRRAHEERTTMATSKTGTPKYWCVYCNMELPKEYTLTVPEVSDDEGWDRLAMDHAPGCEWIATRAHRREVP